MLLDTFSTNYPPICDCRSKFPRHLPNVIKRIRFDDKITKSIALFLHLQHFISQTRWTNNNGSEERGRFEQPMKFRKRASRGNCFTRCSVQEVTRIHDGVGGSGTNRSAASIGTAFLRNFNESCFPLSELQPVLHAILTRTVCSNELDGIRVAFPANLEKRSSGNGCKREGS